jgi:DNA-binding GntR family transcriptional regulator
LPIAVFVPPQASSLTDAVAEAIRNAILAGSLEPGARLVEVSIAQQMRMSRGPVREALRLLEKEGLVARVPRKGTCVASLTVEDVEEIYSFRSVIEGFGIRRAIQYVTAQDIDRIRALVEQIKQVLASDDRRTKNDLTLQVHREICKLSRHKRLLDAWTTIGQQIWLCSAIATHMDLPLPREMLTHEDLLEALESNDPDFAERTIEEHILATGQAVLARFQQEIEQDHSE